MTTWRYHCGDILDIEVDGLICSANPQLNLSGGVGGALAMRCGPDMQRYLHQHLEITGRRFVAPGEVVVTPSLGTPYLATCHAVAIDAFYDTSIELITRTAELALSKMAETPCHTLAMACLACGYGKCSTSDFIRAMLPVMARTWSPIRQITLVSTNADLITALAELINKQATVANIPKNQLP